LSKEESVGLVLWIDQNTFATGLLEKVFKKKNLPFYTLSNASDFVYLVDDLKPEVIVLDTKTALEYLEQLKTQFAASEALRKLPIILIDEVRELDFIKNLAGHINRPFDPFQVPELLENILKAN
jgi:DNA-binding NtrC family response regulator